MLISSQSNTCIKHLVKIRDKKAYRHVCKTVLIEGSHLINELKNHLVIKTLLLLQETAIPCDTKAEKIFRVSSNVMQKLTHTAPLPTMLAEVVIPEYKTLDSATHIIALDQVSDPGNMGTLLRSALAFEWDGVFILDNCVDPFNDKALKAAKGATFTLPMQKGSFEDLRHIIRNNCLHPVVADANGTDIQSFTKTYPILLILGNESYGVSLQAKALSTNLSIPINSNMESLNVGVAGGILMYLLKKN